MTSLKEIMERVRDIIESNNDFVDPVCDVVAESNVEGPKKSIIMPLSQKQVAKITTSDVPM